MGQFQRRYSFLALILALLVIGCGGGKASLEGRWSGVTDKTTLSFSDREVCAEVTPEPENVVIYRWKLEGSELTLTSLTHDWEPYKAPGVTTRWKVQVKGERMTLKSGSATREFKREPATKIDPALVGAWGGNPRLGVFTPYGDLLVLFQHPAFPKRNIPAGCVGEHYRLTLDGNRMKMDGMTPIRLQRHLMAQYEIKNNQLTFKWDRGAATWEKVANIPWSNYK